MEIKVLRTRFRGKNSIGEPFGDRIPVQPVKDEYNAYYTEKGSIYQTVTHDRGEPANHTEEFYQTVFQIIGDEEHKHLYELIMDRDHDNPLKYDAKSDLWYQRTWFGANGRPDTSRLQVDSINTAGTFSVHIRDVKRKEILKEKSVKVTVLPSLMKKDEYQYMLNRLLRIHDRLVVKAENAVGLGNYEINDKKIVPGTPEYDLYLWEKLKPEIYKLMALPATLQRKEYERQPGYKLRRFDNRVLRSYEESGGVRAEGIVYKDDFDIEENKVIKQILQKMAIQVFPNEEKKMPSDEEIRKSINEYVREQFGTEATKWYRKAFAAKKKIEPENKECYPVAYSCGKFQTERYLLSPNRKPREYRIYFREKDGKFDIKTIPDDDMAILTKYNFYPFTDTIVDRPCAIRITSSNYDVVLNTIESISEVFERAENRDDLSNIEIQFKYTGTAELSAKEDEYHYGHRDTKVMLSYVTDVVSCEFNGHKAVNEPIESLYQLYSRIAMSRARKYIVFDKSTESKVEFAQSVEEFKEKSRIDRVSIEQYNKGVSAYREIERMLNHPWFRNITTGESAHLHPTPLFLLNGHYRAIYNALHEIVSYHPSVNSDFEENIYGVRDTALIYEYWVFFELINRFLNLGFSIDGDTETTRMSLKKVFTEHLVEYTCPEKFAIRMRRKIPLFSNAGTYSGKTEDIEVMIGFNCVFGDHNAPAKRMYDKYLLPDYFIRVTRQDGYHWYFLDAKYEEYSESMLYNRATGNMRKNSVADVCYGKYTVKMQKQKFINEFADYHSSIYPGWWNSELIHKNTIEGAYLIVAKYKDIELDQIDPIVRKDRLCGYDSHRILKDKILPSHRFGSIQFYPGAEGELTSLIQMIFEYKEGAETIKTGRPVKIKLKNETEACDVFYNNNSQATHIHINRSISKIPAILHTCWDSTKDHSAYNQSSVSISPQLTSTRKYKYYVKCSCGAQRYENYCINPKCRGEIMKHNVGNYHFRINDNGWEKWNYKCPICGCDASRDNDR